MDQVLIRPILSEKSSLLGTRNQHVFQVAKAANKLIIKKAIENRFDVEVKKVAIINVKGKQKNMSVKSSGRVLRTSGRRANWKKAIVTLSKGTIDILHGDFQD
jgi:large subunit ribosomal protein L23